ncbi:fused MFS/spermidine synthase [Ideonella sp. DXS29W]|uniref:Fused MFS/spermidine synthase n=1 Tax=Ideonella lacteola TaxID=2984193 RepID=A0ABU9BQB8_9BURK
MTTNSSAGEMSLPLSGASAKAGSWLVRILFVGCIFLSAFLLFLVQPIIAKQIMPWFGGSSAVWTTALMFFQLVLLAGYVYTDLATRWLRPGVHAAVHVGLLVLALATLPIVPAETFRPDAQKSPIGQVLLLLLMTVGLPYFCLSTTSPLLQAWYTRLFPGRQVYRLFALSNAASLAALLAYPFLIEPVAGIVTQAQVWGGAFVLFAVLCTGCAWASRRAGELAPMAPYEAPAAGEPGHAPARSDYAVWLGLSAMGSAMLLAITHHLTQHIAPIPLLWLLPLSLYLLTFVLCFEGRSWYRRSLVTAPLILLLAGMAWGINVPANEVRVRMAVPLYAVGCFVCCMFFHGELSERKPAPRYLTRFYLCLSLGGAIGGLLVSAGAPTLFDNYYELPLALLATSVVMLWILRRYLTANMAAWPVAALALASCALTGLMGWVFYNQHSLGNVSMQRNFYAASRVVEFGDGNGGSQRVLYNGGIVHGNQMLAPAVSRTPTTYYGRHSGVADAMTFTASTKPGGRRVGVIGLGAGTMAAWGQAGDDFRFYEINPHSHQIAERDFKYLSESPARRQVVIGDARLMMAEELAGGRANGFDVLVVDAFSGDSIPVHLLTREALAVYKKHLAPGGIIAFHVSNLFLDLAPVVGLLAEDAGLKAVRIRSRDEDPEEYSSAWVLVTDNQAFLDHPATLEHGSPIKPRAGATLWTDDRNNLYEVVR